MVDKICQIPRQLKELQNISVYDLLKNSGYFESPESITIEFIEYYLSNSKNLINDWFVYSSDKRCSTGWYFCENSEKSRYTVGFLNNGKAEQEKHFENLTKACASFIQKEINDMKTR